MKPSGSTRNFHHYTSRHDRATRAAPGVFHKFAASILFVAAAFALPVESHANRAPGPAAGSEASRQLKASARQDSLAPHIPFEFGKPDR